METIFIKFIFEEEILFLSYLWGMETFLIRFKKREM